MFRAFFRFSRRPKIFRSVSSQHWCIGEREYARDYSRAFMIGVGASTVFYFYQRWKRPLTPLGKEILFSSFSSILLGSVGKASALSLYFLSRNEEYRTTIIRSGAMDHLGQLLDELLSINKSGAMNSSIFYSLACISNLALTKEGKVKLQSKEWLARMENAISWLEPNEEQLAFDQYTLAICISSLISSLTSFCDEASANYLIGHGVLPWINNLLQFEYTVPKSELPFPVQCLIEDHLERPLGLPRCNSTLEYNHKSPESSWCHYLDKNECHEYLKLLNILSIAELSLHDHVLDTLFSSDYKKQTMNMLLEVREELKDPVIEAEFIRTLCHLAIHDDFKFEIFSDEKWISKLTEWTSSQHPRILLFTAYLLSILLENRVIGLQVIRMIGLPKIVEIVDRVDIDLQHSIERIIVQLQEDQGTFFTELPMVSFDEKMIPHNVSTHDILHK